MSTSTPSTRRAVVLLSIQTLAFGITAALLIIPASALFLDAYGSKWLPVSYIAVAIVGTAASWLIARAVRRFRLVAVSTVALSTEVLLFIGSWAVLQAGGRFVAAVLLVIFPVSLQMGFVFVGGQAGRLLNIREMKEDFPRVVSGFAIGFLTGGVAGAPLLALFGSPQALLLGAAVTQTVFVAVLILTNRRFPALSRPTDRTETRPDDQPRRRPPLRSVLSDRLVVVIFGYQVLSAVGSQLVDYIMFDRAAARYADPADLTRWVSWVTALVNLLNILVLTFVAGRLLKRFGLRFGLVANPAFVIVILGGMLVVGGSPGTASLAFLTFAAAARIVDLVFTDGTTRTSINATYQVLPVDERVTVQALIEGAGVPAAIGFTGVLLLVLRLLPGGIMVVVGVTAAIAVVWTAVGWMATHAYSNGLRASVGKRVLVDSPLTLDDAAEADALRRMLRSDDSREVTLGLELLSGLASSATDAELRRLLDAEEPEVRLGALAALATDDVHVSTLAAADAAAVVAALDGDGDLRSPATLRVIRACRSLPPQIAAERLGPLVAHPDRDVSTTAMSALAVARPVLSPELDAALREVLQAERERAVRILAARHLFELHPADPLARALDDELETVRMRAVAVLVIRHGDVARRAVRAFGTGSAHDTAQALALEALEVISGRESVTAVTLVRPDLDDRARWIALAGPGTDAAGTADDLLDELIEDPHAVWRSEWLAACARHHRQRSTSAG